VWNGVCGGVGGVCVGGGGVRSFAVTDVVLGAQDIHRPNCVSHVQRSRPRSWQDTLVAER
jgi:hypothetical protein